MEDLTQIFNSQKLTPEMAKKFISLTFDGYKKRQKAGNLYEIGSEIPCLLIMTYYSFVDTPNFNEIYDKFERKYITNENDLEDVHNKKERLGLKEVYKYLSDFDENHWINIYIIMELHQKLYSKVDYPEFGGKIREANCFIASSDVQTCPYDKISSEIQMLWQEFEELVKKSKSIKESKDANELISYINDVIKLKCKLVKIHPFTDGNGRTMRAMLNLFFKLVNLPPVYVSKREKDEYIRAMDEAIRNGNYNLINGFYYYKICDSIIELDFDNTLENTNIKSR